MREIMRKAHTAAGALRLRGSRGSSLGRLDAHSQEDFGVHEGQLDGLAQVPDLIAQAPDGGVVDRACCLVQHVVHHRVHLQQAQALAVSSARC